jgi:myo-inositol-1(or 4)-monophosphatase
MELNFALLDWLAILEHCAQNMRKQILAVYQTAEAAKEYGRGAGGDIKRKIDLVAENALIKTLKEHSVSCTLISEESGTKKIGAEPSEHILVADPLDGTTNALRGLPFMAISLAASLKPYLKNVETALVMDILHNVTYTAQQGKGAYKNKQSMEPSKTTSLKEAIVGVDLNTFKASEIVSQMIRVFEQTKHLRHLGANALEICYVADGTTDAFIDLRGKLRITDMAAAQLILREAGGIITTQKGASLAIPLTATQRVSFIAAANKTVYNKIQALIQNKGKKEP